MASRADVVKLIEDNGGEYSGSVTKRVTHVIVADPSASTQKIVKAVLLLLFLHLKTLHFAMIND